MHRTRSSGSRRPTKDLRARIGTIAVALLLAFAPTTALAAEVRQGDAVIVGSSETVDDDLYAFGGSVDVRGTVNGDLVAAGGTHTVGGVVTGDLIVAGGTITLTGRVDGSVRAGGGTLTIDGPVGGDVVIAGGTVALGPNARVGRDVLAGGGTTTLGGQIGRNVQAGGETITIAGPVGGDVRAEAATLRLAERAAIRGSLVYGSGSEAEIAPGASVGGAVERYVPDWAAGGQPAQAQPGPLAWFGVAVLGWLRTLIGFSVLGLLVLLFPAFSGRTVATLRRSPWASLGLGFGLLVGVPVAAALLFGLGLVVGGWWLGLVALGAYATALAVAFTVTGLFVGRFALDRLGRPDGALGWALLLGLVLLTLVGLVPVVGPLVGFLAVLFGLGALTLAAVRTRREPAAPAPPPVPDREGERRELGAEGAAAPPETLVVNGRR